MISGDMITSVLGHFGPRPFRSSKKDRTDWGPNWLSHFGPDSWGLNCTSKGPICTSQKQSKLFSISSGDRIEWRSRHRARCRDRQ